MDIDKNRLKRLDILEKSLSLESALSLVLSKLFRISDPINSVSFGQTGQALSFNNKVNLLLDSRGLDKTEKKRLKCFMEIRNKFIHNVAVISYEDACGSNNNSFFLEKEFPNCFNSGNNEQQLEKAIMELFKSCAMSIVKMKGLRLELLNIEDKLDTSNYLNQTIQESYRNSILKVRNKIELDKIYSAEHVIGLIDSIDDLTTIEYIPKVLDKFECRNNPEGITDNNTPDNIS